MGDVAVEKKGKKKEVTFVAMLISAMLIQGWSAFKFISAPEAIQIGDVIMASLGSVGCFFPVYTSIIIQALKDLKSLKE